MRVTGRPSFLLGLIGSGIQASRTPSMHQREGDDQGLRILYQKIDLAKLKLGVEALPRLIEAAALTGFAGLNITYPCKQAILPLLDALSDEAAAIGAVNTVVFRHGTITGHNTDSSGFAAGLRNGLPDADMRFVVQLGAGGAGSAVAHALLTQGARELALFDTDYARSERLAGRLGRRFPQALVRAGKNLEADVIQASGLAHCTPTGMANHPGMPLDKQLLHKKLWVAEIVYFPMETQLLKEARRIGCQTLSGAGMAVYQAVDTFRLFTGREPDARRMAKHFGMPGLA